MCSVPQRGRSLQSLGVRDNQIFEQLYELAELLVWVTFRRRDRPVIYAEVTRLFRGAHHNHRQQHHQHGDDLAHDPSFAAPATHTAPTANRRRTKRGVPLSSEYRGTTRGRSLDAGYLLTLTLLWSCVSLKRMFGCHYLAALTFLTQLFYPCES